MKKLSSISSKSHYICIVWLVMLVLCLAKILYNYYTRSRWLNMQINCTQQEDTSHFLIPDYLEFVENTCVQDQIPYDLVKVVYLLSVEKHLSVRVQFI